MAGHPEKRDSWSGAKPKKLRTFFQKTVDKRHRLCYNKGTKKGKETIIMLEFIYAIPENIGWSLVGAVGMLALVTLVGMVKDIATAIKERMTATEEEPV